jgi:hypothetical protein
VACIETHLPSPSTYLIGVSTESTVSTASTYMWTYWLRKCNQQHKAAEEHCFASYWNSGSRKPRVTKGIAKKLSVYGVPRAHAVSGTTWLSPNTDIKGKNTIQITCVLSNPQADFPIETTSLENKKNGRSAPPTSCTMFLCLLYTPTCFDNISWPSSGSYSVDGSLL